MGQVGIVGGQLGRYRVGVGMWPSRGKSGEGCRHLQQPAVSLMQRYRRHTAYDVYAHGWDWT